MDTEHPPYHGRYSGDPVGALLDMAGSGKEHPGARMDAIGRLKDWVWEVPDEREEAITALTLLAGDSDPAIGSTALDCLDALSKSHHADNDPELKRLLSKAIHEAKTS
ncbi:MAG: hypothetical protein M3N59_01170 [bacterium]|nr:hypothetical protein [bacterium]